MNTEVVHNLLAAVMPIPVYVVFESQGAPPALNFGNAIGSTGKAADLVAMDYLVSRGEWRGRAPLIWINDVKVAELASEHHAIREVEQAELERQLLTAVTIHELGHVVDKGIDTTPVSDAHRTFALAIAAYSAVTLHSPERPPFDGHNWKWIRNCVHLQYRAAQAGFEAPSGLIMDHDLYNLPPLDQFAYRLYGQFEPSNLIRESIFEINTFRPPHYFAQLWKDSVRHWLAQQTTYTLAIHPAIDMLEVEPDEVNDVCNS